MDFARYRKIVKFQENLDSAKRRELLRLYLQTPTMPKLQAMRSLLVEMKKSLNHCSASKQKCLQGIRRMLCQRH